MKFSKLEEVYFPHAKQLRGDEFAYISPLTFGRARINVTNLDDIWGVTDFY